MRQRLVSVLAWLGLMAAAWGAAVAELTYPPVLPGGAELVTDTSPLFIEVPEDVTLLEGVTVAREAPTVDFLYYPEQKEPDYWTNWGQGVVRGDKFYSSYGNHKGIGGESFVYEYDATTKRLRLLLDVTKYLNRPAEWYTPGKIHGQLDFDHDGWLYTVTARGSTRVTTPENHFEGEWLIRMHPETGEIETVAYPVLEGDSVMDSLLDPDRMIFYGGTRAGDYRIQETRFFAYDVNNRRLLHEQGDGPDRLMIWSRSTGRVYYTGRESSALYRYDPSSGGPPEKILETAFGGTTRAVTPETADGHIYVISHGGGDTVAMIYRFDAKTEEIEELAEAAVATQRYITSAAIDPTGRYLYYAPGAHMGAQRDHTIVVQFDTRTYEKKVIAFLRPFYEQTYGFMPMGTFGVSLDEAGERLFVTWSGNRGGENERGRLVPDTCAMMVIHIPESERQP